MGNCAHSFWSSTWAELSSLMHPWKEASRLSPTFAAARQLGSTFNLGTVSETDRARAWEEITTLLSSTDASSMQRLYRGGTRDAKSPATRAAGRGSMVLPPILYRHACSLGLAGR